MGMGSRLIGLHLKGKFKGEFLTISRYWLDLGGGVPPELASLSMAKHQNTETKKTWLIQSYSQGGMEFIF